MYWSLPDVESANESPINHYCFIFRDRRAPDSRARRVILSDSHNMGEGTNAVRSDLILKMGPDNNQLVRIAV